MGDVREEPLLSIQGLNKAYAAPVLVDVDFSIRTGEVHALIGANGAGKSTLARIVTGLTDPDGGRMALAGEPYAPASKNEAERLGVQMVMQELNLVPTLSVAENLFLNHLPRRFGFVAYDELYAAAAGALADVGLRDLDPRTPVHRLGVGRQQLVEIAAALARPCRVLILDEPTAALTDPEIDLLFGHVERLKQQGVGILYVSHRMEEIRRIADRITVLRDGHVVTTRPTGELSLDEIVRLMVGREPGEVAPHEGHARGSEALRVEGLRRGDLVQDVSFEVRHGEILGFAGLVGSGRTETMRAIFGADRPGAGAVYLDGHEAPVRIDSPRDAVRAGIGLIPEDRKQHGLLLPLPVRINSTLARIGAVVRPRGWIDRERERERAEDYREALDIRCDSVEQPVAELSGGNQQKVVIARWLMRNCEVLLFDEPTRGIDVAAKWTVYRLLRDLAAEGKALVIVSSELEELMLICDRIAVMSAGRLAASLARGEWTQEKIMAAALSGYVNGAGNMKTAADA